MAPRNGSANGALSKDNPAFTIEEPSERQNGNGKVGHSEINANDITTIQPQNSTSQNGVHAPASTSAEEEKEIKYSDIADEVRCGYWGWKPDWLQVFNNPKMFLFLLCWFSFVQGFVVNGVNNINTASLERRFKLPSSKVGFISSAYDISAGIFVIPVTYFGTYAHQPRLISIASLVMFCGSLIMALPHFTTGLYEYRSGREDVCNLASNTSEVCSDTGLPSYLYVFMLGQFLHGFGGTVLYSLGIVFIDANVKTKDSPLYQGLLYAAAALGPAVGYLLGGALLDIYVDFDKIPTDSLDIGSGDVQWVGAWWVGFIAASVLFLTVFLGIVPYSKELPTAKKIAKYRINLSHQDGAEAITSREDFGSSIKDLPTSLLLLLRNPVLMMATMASVTEGIVTSGFATFLSKFIQNQYGKTASTAAILGGLVVVPGAAGGNAAGGIITKCFKLKVQGMLRLNVILCLSVIVICGVFFAKCPVQPIAGVTVPYAGNVSESMSLSMMSATCNENCGCTTATYQPLCGDDGIQYFSPCHAGCNGSVSMGDTFYYTNCSCVIANGNGTGGKDGVCEDGACDLLYVFLPCFFCIIFLTFMAAVPTVSVTLRCIPDIQRSFALGIQWVFIRFLGTMTGPILFGFVFDQGCLLWQEKCGEEGSCWIYDNRQLSINLAVLGMIIKLCSALFFSFAYCCYKPPTEELSYGETANESSKHAVEGGVQNEAFDGVGMAGGGDTRGPATEDALTKF